MFGIEHVNFNVFANLYVLKGLFCHTSTNDFKRIVIFLTEVKIRRLLSFNHFFFIVHPLLFVNVFLHTIEFEEKNIFI
jgi:hypothetical protein